MAAKKNSRAIRELKRVAKEEGETPKYQAKEFIKNKKANKTLKKAAKKFIREK